MELNCICSIYEFIIKPENWKDYIIPFISPIIGVFGAYWVMNNQIRKQEKLEKNKNNYENESILKVCDASKNKLIDSLKETIDNINALIAELKLSGGHNFKIFVPNSSMFSSITSFGYHKLFTILAEKNNTSEENILKFWSSISYIPPSYDVINEYTKNFVNDYNTLRRNLNSELSSIAVKSSKIIHSKIKPFSRIYYTTSLINSDPELKLAILVNKAIRTFNSDKINNQLVKSKKLLEELDNLKKDPVVSQALDQEYAQQVADSLGILKNFENLFSITKKSLENYIVVFERTIENIENTIFSTEN